MIKKALFYILVTAAPSLNAQTLDWALSMGGSNANGDFGRSICVDALGNVYTTGGFDGTADFDAGVGTASLNSVGQGDIFIQKMDSNGNFLWAKSVGGILVDVATSIDVDAHGDAYITGSFEGTVDFDPGTGVANLTSSGGRDIFILKLDGLGNFVWAKSIGGNSTDEGISIRIDPYGNVFTTGIFGGTVDFDPGPGVTNLTSSFGYKDIFVQKMDANGNFIWSKGVSGVSYDNATSISVDASGNVYITGSFFETIDLDPDAGIANFISAGNQDIFVLKLDSSGSFIWGKSMGGAADDIGYSINVDASGNIFTTGMFAGIVDFDPGPGMTNLTAIGSWDMFVQKLDSNGNFVWSKSIGGFFDDRGYSIGVDAFGNIYTTGKFEGTVDFDPGPGITNLISAGNEDIFIQKLDASGNFLWAGSIGGASLDLAASITVDALNNVYATGSFMNTGDFDPGVGTVNLTSAGGHDIFVLKMNPITTSTNTLRKDIPVSIFPNPSTGTVNILLDESLKDVEIILADITGKIISTRSHNSFISTSFELPETKGIYLLTITTKKEGKTTMKLIKD